MEQFLTPVPQKLNVKQPHDLNNQIDSGYIQPRLSILEV